MISAIIDIGSGSVGVALVATNKGKAPTIRFSTRKEIATAENITPKRLLDKSLEAITTAVDALQRSGMPAPSEIFCFLSSHLTASQTRTIKVDLGRAIKISDQLISDLVDKEFANIKDEAVIERKIMQARLNGYEVSNVHNKVASEVEVSVFYTISSNSLLKSIKDVVAGAFHNDRIEFHSFSFAYFSILRDLFRAEHDFIFMDIGSEITDVNLVKAGVLTQSVTFPSGKNQIIKTWTETVQEVLNGFNVESPRSQKIFLLADKSVSDVFKTQLNSNGESDVKDITSAELNKICDNRSGAADDVFLMISAIFVNKLLY